MEWKQTLDIQNECDWCLFGCHCLETKSEQHWEAKVLKRTWGFEEPDASKSENQIKRQNERENRNSNTSSQTPKNKLRFGQEQTCTNRASNYESFGVGTGLIDWKAASKEWMATRRNWENSLSNLKKMRGKGQNSGQNSDRQSKILEWEKLTIISNCYGTVICPTKLSS